MLFPRYEARHIMCDNPECFRSIPGLGFSMLIALAKQASWRIVKDGPDYWHFCCPECMRHAKARREKNRRILHGARAWKMGTLTKQAEREKERMEVGR